MAPKEFEVVATYVFSGKFEVPINFADIEKTRVLYADIQVVRKPRSPYFSDKTNPVNGFLGTFTTNIDGLTIRRYDIEYEKTRVYLFGEHLDPQQIYAARCYDALDTARLIVAVAELGGSISSAQNPFSADLTAPGINFDSLLFKCYADTALSVTLGKLEVLECSEDYPFPTPPPPKPPAPPVPPFYPPGEPISGSDYSPPPDNTDPENYEPYPGDEPDPPLELPIEGECLRYRFTITYERYNVGSVQVEIDLGAPIINFYTEEQVPFPAIDGLYAVANGVWGTGGQCAGVLPTLIYNDLVGGSTFTIDSIVLVP